MKISWEEVHKWTYANKIERPTMVVGIARGGMIPATLLAYRFDVPLYSVTCTSLGEKTHVYLPSNLESALKKPNKKLLLVDDISDTGKTLFAVHRMVGACESFSLVYKPTSGYKPTYYGLTYSGDDWVDFPWDKEPQ